MLRIMHCCFPHFIMPEVDLSLSSALRVVRSDCREICCVGQFSDALARKPPAAHMTSSDCQGRPGKKEEQIQARALVGEEGPVKIMDSSGHGRHGDHQHPQELRYDPG